MAKNTDKETEWAQTLEKEFLAAYENHADELLRHCVIRIRDREVAKDIVQESFARTWTYLSAGKKVTHIRAFLYRVANNLLIDGVRKKKSSSLDKMIDDDGYEAVDESTKDPADVPAAREAMKMLDELEDIYKTVITMRYVEEMSPKEIAAALGVSENVVSVRIHRGIERLSKRMNAVPLSFRNAQDTTTDRVD